MSFGRGGLRLLGAPGWSLERGPISNDEEGGKRIFWDYLRILFIPVWDIRTHSLGLGSLNSVAPGSSPVSTPPPPLNLLMSFGTDILYLLLQNIISSSGFTVFSNSFIHSVLFVIEVCGPIRRSACIFSLLVL